MPTPCSVTGTMQTLSGGKVAQGTVIFQLSNIGTGTIPRVIGTGEFPSLKFATMTAQDGTFATQLWGNDNIDPANTIYLVTFRDFLGNEVGPVQFSITGVSANLNTLTPTSTVLPPILTTFGFATGTPLVGGNFGFSGWGTGATLSVVSGTQMGYVILLTAGTTPSTSPTVTLTFPTAYPLAPVTVPKMTGGTGQYTDISTANSTTQSVLTYLGLPVATKTYIFSVITLGQ